MQQLFFEILWRPSMAYAKVHVSVHAPCMHVACTLLTLRAKRRACSLVCWAYLSHAMKQLHRSHAVYKCSSHLCMPAQDTCCTSIGALHTISQAMYVWLQVYRLRYQDEKQNLAKETSAELQSLASVDKKQHTKLPTSKVTDRSERVKRRVSAKPPCVILYGICYLCLVFSALS